MTAQILDGNVVAKQIKNELRSRIDRKRLKPMISVCLIGDDPASEIYVKRKQEACRDVGINSELKRFDASSSRDEIESWIVKQNELYYVHGILIQLPLPAKFNRNHILDKINPLKDVDCFHPYNSGLLLQGEPRFLPCTPAGIFEIFKYYKIETRGANAVIVNDSIIVGKPLSLMLLNEKATVTICHEHTKDLSKICCNADIIITAVGKENYRLRADMVKENATVIDVGIFREEGSKIRGDVVFGEVSEKAGSITKVPGGVGPLTVACLLRNAVDACERLML